MAIFYATSFAKRPNHNIAPLVLEHCQATVSEKVALDLGCGSGSSSFFLLERGWKVVAIDADETMLARIREEGRAWIESGQLTVTQADIHELKLSDQFDLVIASDIFPYLNPKKLFEVWVKIHQATHKGGFFIGSFFDNSRRTMDMNPGLWVIPDQQFVQRLLERFNYETHTLQNRKKIDKKSSIVEFAAQKK
jgi:SAM-dependent methyltransferase